MKRQRPAICRGCGRFSNDITFRSTTKPGGAVLNTELSAADGQGIIQVAATKVRC